MKDATSPRRDVYGIINDKIIEQLEKGTVPWQKPWGKSGMPTNLVSSKAYRGINVFLLASLGYAQNFFLSEKQVQELGATIRENEKPHMVVFWNWQEKEAKEGEEPKKVPLLRYYMVYNVSQCLGIPPERIPEVSRPSDPIALADKIIEEMPMCPEIIHFFDKAFYDPMDDLINTPEMKYFDSRESYYGVLFHELIHSTGHQMRCSRKGITERIVFGSELYSQEEIIAELGACYLKNLAGIETEPTKNNVAYIQNWIKALKDNTKMIVYASSYAQKAVDYILRVDWEKNVSEQGEMQNPLQEVMPQDQLPEPIKKQSRKVKSV